MVNALHPTSRQWHILQIALEHLKIEYEVVGDPEDEVDLKLMDDLLRDIRNNK